MYTATIQNSSGNYLDLTGNERRWTVLSISGLNPPPANVNTTSMAGSDGSKFNSAHVNQRNIVIQLRINGDVETNRAELYGFFAVKENVNFLYKTNSRQVVISGYGESVECDLFSNSEVLQASIICPQPWFFDTTAGGTVSTAIDENTPVTNASELAVGALITFSVTAACSLLELENVTTGDSLSLSGTFNAGDVLIVNTTSGSRSVTLTRGGSTTSLFSAVQIGSTFIQIPVGQSRFTFSTNLPDSSNADCQIQFTKMYRGV